MPLADTNLVVRYYFDEAASGTTETTVNDASGNNYDLTANFGAGATDLEWAEVSGNRGLQSKDVDGDQRAVRAIDNTSDAFRDAVHGATKVTFELVLDLTGGTANNGRIFVVNDDAGNNPTIGPTAVGTTNWRYYWNGTAVIEQNTGFANGRAVYHIVYDSTQAANNDRCKVYLNGSVQAYTLVATITQNATVSLPTGAQLIAFNRLSSTTYARSITGTLFYAAVYNDAFSSTRVTDHYNVLTSDDDTPAGASAVEPSLSVASGNDPETNIIMSWQT